MCSVFGILAHNWKQQGPKAKLVFFKGIDGTFIVSASVHCVTVIMQNSLGRCYRTIAPSLSVSSSEGREVHPLVPLSGILFHFLLSLLKKIKKKLANQPSVMSVRAPIPVFGLSHSQQNVLFHGKMLGSKNEWKLKCAGIVSISRSFRYLQSSSFSHSDPHTAQLGKQVLTFSCARGQQR